MIEMDEEEYSKAAVDDDTLRLILELEGPAVKDLFLYPKYEQIQQTGSDELKEIIFIITGGVAPGNKERERDAS